MLATSANDFGFDLYRRLDRRGNLAIAPANLAVSLGMAAGGARGQTLAEMRRVLRHTLAEAEAHAALGALARSWNRSVRGLSLSSAQRLFVHSSLALEAPFVDLTQRHYAAPAEGLDFAQPEPARTRINQWVGTQTRDRIPEILPTGSISDTTRLVLVSAMHLSAPWQHPFTETETRPETFRTPTQAAPVPMMRMSRNLLYGEVPGAKLLELPYVGGDHAMVVILPNRAEDLATITTRLGAAQLDEWLEGLENHQVDLRLPRFRVGGETLALRSALQALGLRQAFDPDAADFTGIANPPSPADRLAISNAFHRVFVDVREAGTEAAAATAVVFATRTGARSRPPPATFHADHPFLWLIRDQQTGAVLFMGQVTDPR